MTLLTAREQQAPFVDNGRCQSTNRVRDAINEAQRRIYESGDYLNIIRRWAVTVDENGEFSQPDRCASISRVAELGEGITHSTNGTTISRDAHAFIMESGSILQFTMVTPGRYKIIGPYPQAVDIMGRVVYADAVEDTDNLLIDDTDALKLMIQGIWRESNNAPELAADLIGKATQHMQNKTTLAVETAKRGFYQHRILSCPPNTRGYIRSRLAMELSMDRADDARLANMAEDAERRIMAETSMSVSYLCKAIGGYFTLPREIESILRIDIDNVPARLNGSTYEFLQYGTGYREAPNNEWQATYRGEYALQADMPYASQLTITAGGSNRGIKVQIEGRSGQLTVRETITINGGETVTTVNVYDDVTSITAPPRDGILSFIVGDREVALLQTYDTDTRRARYSLPHLSSDCEPRIIRVLGRPRWISKVRDEQRMQIENDQAIRHMAIAMELERSAQYEQAERMHARAVKMVSDELLLRNMGHSVKVDRARTGIHLKKANRGR
jgi:hypothetical protein